VGEVRSYSLEEVARAVCMGKMDDEVLKRAVERWDGEESELIRMLAGLLECMSCSRSELFRKWVGVVRRKARAGKGKGKGREKGRKILVGMFQPMVSLFASEVRSGDKHRGALNAGSCAGFLRDVEKAGLCWVMPKEWRERRFVEALSLAARVCEEVEEREGLVRVLVDKGSEWAFRGWCVVRKAYERMLRSVEGERREHVGEICRALREEGGRVREWRFEGVRVGREEKGAGTLEFGSERLVVNCGRERGVVRVEGMRDVAVGEGLLRFKAGGEKFEFWGKAGLSREVLTELSVRVEEEQRMGVWRGVRVGGCELGKVRAAVLGGGERGRRELWEVRKRVRDGCAVLRRVVKGERERVGGLREWVGSGCESVRRGVKGLRAVYEREREEGRALRRRARGVVRQETGRVKGVGPRAERALEEEFEGYMRGRRVEVREEERLCVERVREVTRREEIEEGMKANGRGLLREGAGGGEGERVGGLAWESPVSSFMVGGRGSERAVAGLGGAGGRRECAANGEE
jgi:hypothetical protein